jgi:hypothetical protein
MTDAFSFEETIDLLKDKACYMCQVLINLVNRITESEFGDENIHPELSDYVNQFDRYMKEDINISKFSHADLNTDFTYKREYKFDDFKAMLRFTDETFELGKKNIISEDVKLNQYYTFYPTVNILKIILES